MILYKDYFKRQLQLWGDEAQERLSKKSILIVGSGGLGNSNLLALSGSGIGRVDIIDFDRVDISNIHRQLIFSIDDIGINKAQVAINKIKNRTPFTKFNYYPISFEEFIKEDRDYDLIIDATDSISVRIEIDKWAKKKKICWIYGSVEEFMGQVAIFKDSSFFAQDMGHKVGGVLPSMVMSVASFQSTLALRFLANLKVEFDKLYYLYWSDSGEFNFQKFNLPK